MTYLHSHATDPTRAGWDPHRMWAHLVEAHGLEDAPHEGMPVLIPMHDREVHRHITRIEAVRLIESTCTAPRRDLVDALRVLGVLNEEMSS